ncbi:MAG: protein-L-isoaspartate O-methyltransferase, partial [Deltaproteobacteria bacterium]|nr:protein-L-isoaspartate O-methyltransferase [Deltaproteobacteria bacterium]
MLFDFPLEEMIQQQLVSRGIDDQRVIEAFRAYDRGTFVPPYLMNRAYEDERLPIGVGQTISPP